MTTHGAVEGVPEVFDLSNAAFDAGGVIAINQRGNLGELADRGPEAQWQDGGNDERPED